MLFNSEFLSRLERLELVVRRTRSRHLAGQRTSSLLGGGLEFSDYRPYQPGDDYRYIDWNLYSRLGQLFLKQFIEERDTLVFFLLDTSHSMGFGTPSKLNLAARIAGALGYIALRQQDRVGAVALSHSADDILAPVKGQRQITRLFDRLEGLTAAGSTQLNTSLRTFCQRHRQPGLAVVISDLLSEEGYQDGLKQLKARGWEVLLIHLLDRQELEPSPGEGPVDLFDTETGRKKEIPGGQEALDAYHSNLERFLAAAEDSALRFGVLYVQIANDTELEHLLFSTLRRKGGLR